MTSVLFRNGALLDPMQPDLLPGHEVLVEDGRIKEVSDRPIKTTSARVIDLKGKTLMPGLIDLHVHVIAVEFNLPRVATMPNVLVTLRAVPLDARACCGAASPRSATPAAPVIRSSRRSKRDWPKVRACSSPAAR